jgi:hypothetical protein
VKGIFILAYMKTYSLSKSQGSGAVCVCSPDCHLWRHYTDLYSHVHGTVRNRRTEVRYGIMSVFRNASCDNSFELEQVLSMRVIYLFCQLLS